MVHVVRKQVHGKWYLYLQRSVYNKGKRSTQHVAYLGKEGTVSKAEIQDRIKEERGKK